MKFLTPYGDQKKARTCYVSSTKGKKKEETMTTTKQAIDKPQSVEKL